LQLDLAAPVLAKDSRPIVLAKIDAEKHSRVASQYKIRYLFRTIFSGLQVSVPCIYAPLTPASVSLVAKVTYPLLLISRTNRTRIEKLESSSY